MPRQLACQQCNLKRKACDHKRPCQRCVKKKQECIYAGDIGYQNPTLLRASRVRTGTQLQANDSSDQVPGRTTTRPGNLEATNKSLDRNVLPVVAGPNNTQTLFSAQHESKQSTNETQRQPRTATHLRSYNGSDDIEMADINPLGTQSKRSRQQSDESYQPPQPRQQLGNTPKRARTEDEDSHHGSDSEAGLICQPCRDQRKGCDRTQPCSRCIKRGIAHQCVPTVPKLKRRKLNNTVDQTKPVVEEGRRNSRMKFKAESSKPRPISPIQPHITAPPEKRSSLEMENPQGDGRRQRRTQPKVQPTPSLAPSKSRLQQKKPSIETNPMLKPKPSFIPALIFGRGRGLYIIPLDNLTPQGQTDHAQATQTQHSLFELRYHNPPQRGSWPRIIVDSSWSQPTQALPRNVNVLIHIPETEIGDFWGLYSAPVSRAPGQEKISTHVGDPTEGTVFWSVIDKEVLNLLRGKNALPRIAQLQPPTFPPGTRGFDIWRSAAEAWLHEYELPIEESHVCKCRRMRKDGGKTIVCQAGVRCAFGAWHLSCLGIPEDRVVVVEKGMEWWCPYCRIKFKEKAGTGNPLEGERLDLGGETGMDWDVDEVNFGGVRGWSDVSGRGMFSMDLTQ